MPEILEKPLVEDEGDTADLLHFSFSSGVAIDEVRCDGNGQFPPKLLPAKP